MLRWAPTPQSSFAWTGTSCRSRHRGRLGGRLALVLASASDAAFVGSELRDELVRSRALLEERLQRRCRTLAYPYTDLNGSVVDATEAAGYAYAATIPIGHMLSVPLRWSRVGVFRSDSPRRFKLLTSRAARGFLATSTGTMTADAVRSAKGQTRRVLRTAGC